MVSKIRILFILIIFSCSLVACGNTAGTETPVVSLSTLESVSAEVSPTPEPEQSAHIPEDMGLIPNGIFEMGDHHDLGGGEHATDEIPIHEVHVDALYMAAYETTNAQYAKFLNAALAQGSIELRDGDIYRVGSDDLHYETRTAVDYAEIDWDGSTFSVLNNRENHPVVGVRWLGAAPIPTGRANRMATRPSTT